MRKAFIPVFLLVLLLVIAIGMSCGVSYAAEDWSKYESGRNNIRLDGYHGQPGYIVFYDGDGNIAGYLYASRDSSGKAVQLIFVTPGAFSTAFGISQLTEADYGNIIDMETTTE